MKNHVPSLMSVVCLLVFAGYTGESAEDEPRTLNVTSSGFIEKYPDRARVSYRISSEHTDPVQAYEELLKKLAKFDSTVNELADASRVEIQKSGTILSSSSPGYISSSSVDPLFSSAVNYTFIFAIESPDSYPEDYVDILKFIGRLKENGFFPDFQTSMLPTAGSIPRVYIAYFFSDIQPVRDELIQVAKEENLAEAREAAVLTGMDPDRLQIDGHNLNADRLEFRYGGTSMIPSQNFPGVPEFTKVGLGVKLYLTYKEK